MTTLTVGQPVKVYDNTYRACRVYDGTVVKIGRKLVTIQWNFSGFTPTETVFRMDDGTENDGYGHRWFKTVEQAEADDRLAAAREYLLAVGIELTFRSDLTGPQIEELAATVKHMLSEKPADSASETKGGGA